MDVAIVSPEREVFRGEAERVMARSPEGEFAILRGHIPFLAALVPGPVAVVTSGGRDVFFVSGGFLEASGSHDDYHVIVLADEAEPSGDLDVAAARATLEALQRRSDGNDVSEAQLRAARARVDLAERSGE